MALSRIIVANYFARAWSGLISVGFVPVYIKFMGIEAYGLIGVYLSLVAILSLMDLGLSGTLSRELARKSEGIGQQKEIGDLVRTLEAVYWSIGIVLGIGVFFSASAIGTYWVNSTALSPEALQGSIMLMGGVVTAQWATSFYSSGLIGLQRQVSLNILVVAFSTVRAVGAVAVLWLVAPTVQVFFAWQLVVGFAQTIATAVVLWKCLRVSPVRAQFEMRHLRNVSRFASGLTVISLLAVALTQVDKVILSKLLSLEAFGYYTLATVVAGGMLQLVTPISSALFPQFAKLAAGHDEDGMRELYHLGTQLVAVVVFPAATICALFGKELLLAWTGDQAIADNTSPILALLVIGTAMNGLMYIPSAVQLAHGWTRLGIYTNAVGVIVLVPLVIVLAQRYGGAGAASVWMILNACYLFIALPCMHSRLLKGELRKWYWGDVGLPLLGTVCIGWGGTLFISPALPKGLLIASLVGLVLVMVSAEILMSAELRTRLAGKLIQWQ